MSYDAFIAMVNALISRKKLNIKPRFYNDTDDGKYYAYCGNIKIIGHSSSKKVTVRWGSGHIAMAKI